MKNGLIHLLLGAMLALLAMGVTSPALLEEPAGQGPTLYGCAVALAVLVGIIALGVERRREETPALPPVAGTAVCLILGGLIGARLAYCLIRLPYYLNEVGIVHALAIREGGFLLYGALLGVLAAVAIRTRGGWSYTRKASLPDGPVIQLLRVQKGSFAAAMDELALPGMLTIMLARLSEGFAGEGLGNWVEDEALWRFPFAAQNSYGEYQWAIFAAEAAAALLILLIASRVRKGEGERAMTAVLLYACCQIVFESLRMDSVLKIGFVRVSQVASAVAILAVTLLRSRKCAVKTTLLRVLFFACCVGAVGGIEWALDKTPISNGLLYMGMIAACALLCINARKRKGIS